MKLALIRAAAAASVASCLATAALADSHGDHSGLQYYGSVGVGLSVVLDKELTFVPGGATNVLTVPVDNGIVIVGAAGVKLSNGIRLELEAGYSQNKLSGNFSVLGLAGPFDQDGEFSMSTSMFNALYDFEVGEGFSLLGGAGVGVAFLDVDFQRGASAPSFRVADGSDTRFAYQLILGAGYDVADDLELFLRYAYLGTVGRDMTVSNTAIGTGRAIDVPFNRHSVSVGATLYFGE